MLSTKEESDLRKLKQTKEKRFKKGKNGL